MRARTAVHSGGVRAPAIPRRFPLVFLTCGALTPLFGCRPLGTLDLVHAAAFASARASGDTGTGWGAGCGIALYDAYGFIGGEFSETRYRNGETRSVRLTLLRFWDERDGLNLVSAGGTFYQWSDGDSWGLGAAMGIGPGLFKKRAVVALTADLSFWFGSDGEDFDSGAAAGLRLMAGVGF